MLIYIKLWIQAFMKIYRRESFKSAYFIMIRARRERSIQELRELNKLLEGI